MNSRIPVICLLASLIFFSGCASHKNSLNRDPSDPLEPFNRVTFGVNQVIDGLVIRPTAWTYKHVIPYSARYGTGNFLSNLALVPTVVNDLLQGKIRQALQDTVPVLGINSTLGMGGVFDLAKYMGLPHHYADFGETFYHWGWHHSSYFVIPIFGSSTIRDTLGRVPAYAVDAYTNPLKLTFDSGVSTGVTVLALTHYRSDFLEMEKILLSTGLDPYLAYRSAYLQHRQYRLAGGELTTQPEAAVAGTDLGAEVGTEDNPNLIGEPPA